MQGKIKLLCFSIIVALNFNIIGLAYSDSSIPLVPDSQYTTGDLCDSGDPDFKGYRYGEKIPYCERNVSYEKRVEIYQLYEIPEHTRKDYTIDHFIPLSIGGSNDYSNLWPEHKKIKESRMYLEQEVFEDVRDGTSTQADAVRKIIYEKTHPGYVKGIGTAE